MVVVEGFRVNIGEMKVGLEFGVSVIILHDGHVVADLMEDVLKSVPLAQGLERHVEATLWFSAELAKAKAD